MSAEQRRLPRDTEPGPGLTARERSILVMRAEGLTIDEIGKRLYLSPDTIKTHLKRTFVKLGARNIAQAIWLGLQFGEIELGERPELKQVRRERLDNPSATVRLGRKRARKHVPPEVYERFASLSFNEQEWMEAFAEREELFSNVVDGLVKVISREDRRGS